MAEDTGKWKSMDIWMLLMIIFVMGLVVLGFWMSGKALSHRIDEVNLRLKNESAAIQTRITDLRDEMRMSLTKPTAAPKPAAGESATPSK